MNNEVTVRNNFNMIIGWVRDIGNRKLATHIRKGYVGAYNKNSDMLQGNKMNSNYIEL